MLWKFADILAKNLSVKTWKDEEPAIIHTPITYSTNIHVGRSLLLLFQVHVKTYNLSRLALSLRFLPYFSIHKSAEFVNRKKGLCPDLLHMLSLDKFISWSELNYRYWQMFLARSKSIAWSQNNNYYSTVSWLYCHRLVTFVPLHITMFFTWVPETRQYYLYISHGIISV